MIKPIAISIQPTTNAVVLMTLEGQLDSVTSAQVEKELDRLLDDKKYRVVLNLANVSYISSAGWGIFISILKEIKSHEGDLKLVGLSDDVLQVFQLLEINFYLPTYKSNEEAVRAFQ